LCFFFLSFFLSLSLSLSLSLVLTGKVQNVYYAQYAATTAHELGVVGWVKSMSTEQIEIVAEGTYEQLCQFLRWCHVSNAIVSLRTRF
jgi:acylphosphatase